MTALGITREYHKRHGSGTFDVEHHIYFLNEVNLGRISGLGELALSRQTILHCAETEEAVSYSATEQRGQSAAPRPRPGSSINGAVPQRAIAQ
jgi:hypothetical protein